MIINNPKIDMENVKGLVICNSEKSTIYPSIGLEAGDTCHLFVDRIDKDNAYYEGVKLSGISNVSCPTLKVYVAFDYNHQVYEQYILLEGDAK